MTGDEFRHVVFTRHLAPSIDTLHVYIGGDGRAFLSRDRVAADPTPRDPLTLELMLADQAPSAYVGRPCYHGAPAQHCQPLLWTLQRYSEPVVSSLTAVIRDLTQRYPQARTMLIGYSGGGVLALLVAARIARVDTVVTLAAPLDTDAWTRAHGYTPLAGSINPATVQHWPPRLRQVHVHGSADRNVPPELVSGLGPRFVAGGARVEFRVVDGFDHVCCWRRDWPGLLEGFLADPGGGRENTAPSS